MLLLGCAFSAACAAIALPDDAPVRSSELWIVTAALTLVAALCFLAHRDVNRGRRAREFEVEELPP